jgi:hypothetical protein
VLVAITCLLLEKQYVYNLVIILSKVFKKRYWI